MGNLTHSMGTEDSLTTSSAPATPGEAPGDLLPVTADTNENAQKEEAPNNNHGNEPK